MQQWTGLWKKSNPCSRPLETRPEVAGIGMIIAFKLIGHYSDLRQATATHAFDPIIVVAGLIPLLGTILVPLLVRNTSATRRGLVREI